MRIHVTLVVLVILIILISRCSILAGAVSVYKSGTDKYRVHILPLLVKKDGNGFYVDTYGLYTMEKFLPFNDKVIGVTNLSIVEIIDHNLNLIRAYQVPPSSTDFHIVNNYLYFRYNDSDNNDVYIVRVNMISGDTDVFRVQMTTTTSSTRCFSHILPTINTTYLVVSCFNKIGSGSTYERLGWLILPLNTQYPHIIVKDNNNNIVTPNNIFTASSDGSIAIPIHYWDYGHIQFSLLILNYLSNDTVEVNLGLLNSPFFPIDELNDYTLADMMSLNQSIWLALNKETCGCSIITKVSSSGWFSDPLNTTLLGKIGVITTNNSELLLITNSGMYSMDVENGVVLEKIDLPPFTTMIPTSKGVIISNENKYVISNFTPSTFYEHLDQINVLTTTSEMTLTNFTNTTIDLGMGNLSVRVIGYQDSSYLSLIGISNLTIEHSKRQVMKDITSILSNANIIIESSLNLQTDYCDNFIQLKPNAVLLYPSRNPSTCHLEMKGSPIGDVFSDNFMVLYVNSTISNFTKNSTMIVINLNEKGMITLASTKNKIHAIIKDGNTICDTPDVCNTIINNNETLVFDPSEVIIKLGDNVGYNNIPLGGNVYDSTDRYVGLTLGISALITYLLLNRRRE